MKLVVGLGNPGRKYDSTRHNVGFDVLDRLTNRFLASSPKSKFQGQCSDIRFAETTVVLLRPLTYMNRSGMSVRSAVDFYRLPLADVLVVCDDFQLPLGRLRFRARGSSGGQKGLEDIIQKLSSTEVARLRVGIGEPGEHWDPVDFVLSRFSPDERILMDSAIDRAADGVVDWITHGIEYCMNVYNRPAK